MGTGIFGNRKKMSVHLVDTDATIRRINEKVKYVKENVFIGTPIKIKVLGGAKTEYRILKLQRIEGKHYIFVSEHGWVEAYTLKQLCFDVSNGNIKIIKEDKSNDKK